MDDRPTLQQKADKWMADNPDAMRHFARFAEQMRERGYRFGVQLLVERVRWEMLLRGGTEVFKINNSYTAYIARRLIANDERLAELIKCRVTHAADKPARDPNVAPSVNP